MQKLLLSLLELGNSTSKNLGFVHLEKGLSYGEETITENNLLELRRRHPDAVELQGFGKQAEARNGADWEWHIIGHRYTFGMRVQAKRLQKDGKLKVNYLVGAHKKPQIDLLLKDAKKHSLAPIYCFYCTEPQRSKWKKGTTSIDFLGFEAGCLLAPAKRVKSVMPTSLGMIEEDTVPWHFLAANATISKSKPQWLGAGLMAGGSMMGFVTGAEYEAYMVEKVDRPATWTFPTMVQLNTGDDALLETPGVSRTDKGKRRREMPKSWYQERGVGKLLVIDLRRLTDEPDEPRRHR